MGDVEGVPKVAINGFGRIGRLVTRAILENEANNKNMACDIVAINDLSHPDMLANLFEFDSIHGRFEGSVKVDNDTNELILSGDRFKVLATRDPEELPWKELDTDYVIECTGFFRSRKTMTKHLNAGAKKVILSAPAKPGTDADATIVRGVNQHILKPEHKLVSNASCTTNCLAPVLKVLDDAFSVKNGIMTTIHAITNDQRLLDSQHGDFRRSRAAMMSMVPTTTGAAKAIALVMPHLAGKLNGLAVRVPTPNVSIVDLTMRLKRDVTQAEVEDSFRKAADEPNPLQGIIDYSWRSLVSNDFNHNPHSAIVDFPSMMVVDGSMLKILAWYDNEWAYAQRCAELIFDLWKLDK
ncbi:MAG: type I glyceraldehyde-3-phosphate dehydrogenase [Candidatus Hodarchaeales archaeon]|jgi:glyceraldehyde 3-phosphate dehydrogenase